jgi:TIR domain
VKFRASLCKRTRRSSRSLPQRGGLGGTSPRVQVRFCPSVATLDDYFARDFTTLMTKTELTLTRHDGSGVPATITARVHYDTNAYARYVSYLVPASTSLDSLDYLISHVGDVMSQVESGTMVTMGNANPGVFADPPMLDVRTLPFSGRIYAYVDAAVSPERARGFIASAGAAGLHLEIRDASYAEFQAMHEQPLAFICHDSRDKDDVARPLAVKLSSMLCPVWFDEFTLRIGDSLRESIDTGLSECPKCIVILSPNFCDLQGWTSAEFNGAMARHIAEGRNVILPIWHNMTRDDVMAYSPMIADVFALKSDLGVDELARQISRVVTPAPPAAT